MGLEAGSFLDALVATNPIATDGRSEGDDHIRLIKTVLKNTLPGMSGRFMRTLSKTGAYTAVATDNSVVFAINGNLTLTLDAAANLGNGWFCFVRVNEGVTLTLAAASLIYVGSDGATSHQFTGTRHFMVLCAGSTFFVMGLEMPSNTTMLFQQTTPPVGWTKVTTHNDKSLRIVSGAVGSGGTVPFSTVFGRTATDAHTLTTGQIPSHQHAGSSATVGTLTANTAGNHTHTLPIKNNTSSSPGASPANSGDGGSTLSTGGAGDHSHNVTGTINLTIVAEGGGGSHTHGIDTRVQYVDVIIATKD